MNLQTLIKQKYEKIGFMRGLAHDHNKPSG